MAGNVCGAVTNPMHETMQTALAEGLGLTRAELDSRLAAGETPAQIAEDLGLSREDFLAVLTEARAAAWWREHPAPDQDAATAPTQAG